MIKKIDDNLATRTLIPITNLLFGNSLFWLLVSSFLIFLASITSIYPDLFKSISYLNYGKLLPVGRDLFFYGWASQAAYGSAIWIIEYFAKENKSIRYYAVFIYSLVMWNIGLIAGSLAILMGYNTGIEYLEYPVAVLSLLLILFCVMSFLLLIIFPRIIHHKNLLAIAYLFTSIISLPCIYGTSIILLIWKPVIAPAQIIINSWYLGNLLILWLFFMSLSICYTLIPQLCSSSLFYNNISFVAFYFLLLLSGWMSMDHLIGGPMPAWMSTAAVISGVLFIIPITIIKLNFSDHLLINLIQNNISSLCLKSGVFLLIPLAIVSIVCFLPSLSAIFQFTAIYEGKMQIILAIVSFIFFSLLYHIFPICSGSHLAKKHFFLFKSAILLLISLLFLDGLLTGISLSDTKISFINVLSFVYPFRCLESLAQLLIFCSVVILSWNFFLPARFRVTIK